jgi:NADH-quinone oxidoreductase subunit E
MAQIGKDYYEDLTAESFAKLIDELAAGRVPTPGPQNGRFASEPLGGATTLKGWTGEAQNGSVALATRIGDTVKRIDGTEVPLLTPWLGKPAAATPAKGRPVEPTPGAGAVADATGTTVQEAKASSRGKPKADGNAPNATPLATPEAKASGQAGGVQPAGLSAPKDGKADDLKLIVGIGPKLEALCNRLGFFHFDQIANWTAGEVAWVDENLEGFKGRVTRDKWVVQARILAAGGTVAEAEAAARA